MMNGRNFRKIKRRLGKTHKMGNGFLFSMNVLDGDLTPCMKIPYVYCERNRKHYNLKNKDLPRTVDEYYGWGYKFELPSEYMLY